MWKECYRTGIDLIDTQHQTLFDMTGQFIETIKNEDAGERVKECAELFEFLKAYAVKHFAEEEEYQLSIRYCDLEKHKALHRIFTSTILNLEKKLVSTDYSIAAMKEIAGFLTSWLIYHVAGVDQKLKKHEMLSDTQAEELTSYLLLFAQSANQILVTMTGIPAGNVTFSTYSGENEDIRIVIGLVGDHTGEAVFTYTNEITRKLIESMTNKTLTEIDEFVYSVLREVTNIISGKASSLISALGKTSDITPPRLLADFHGIDNREGFTIDTEIGRMAVSVSIE